MTTMMTILVLGRNRATVKHGDNPPVIVDGDALGGAPQAFPVPEDGSEVTFSISEEEVPEEKAPVDGGDPAE